MNPGLSVRELRESDVDLIIRYWSQSSPEYLFSMGVDLKKLPDEKGWRKMLHEQLATPLEKKNSYCIIWELNQQPIGHSNTNPTHYGESAFMHLHIWNADIRRKGYGTALLKLTLPYFFKNLQLKKLYCQPVSINSAPNKTLQHAGFDFVKEHITVPGAICFEQPSRLWEMSLKKFIELYSA